jgi:addiction module RelE/StbE family toxin
LSIYTTRITEPAKNDLKEIGHYITEELLEPAIAIKLVDKIGDVVLSLEEMPHRNTPVSDERLSSSGIRKQLVENYIIFYKISEAKKIVTVIRILYTKRDWLSLL